ncbi:hypothetical protein Tdes44962_MAKER08729 [Teratosphaeria destructans]|uniref:Uncharacterized protein n=1 Tax=Teratosphaeria destructans TaxID=418781 RepID=A0A9W7SVW5_9PEZI|nr:hypothetical protein Tdes44962_MAKER08729 [Teratosphaeria destructans]
MAPQGMYTRSRTVWTILAASSLACLIFVVVAFHEDLRSAVNSLRTKQSCPTPTSHLGQHHQDFIPTTFADLTILEELPATNVLFIDEGNAEPPVAWGISMFHALHCVKMWKESLDPATMMKSHVHGESEYAEHASHCINYLIQVSSVLACDARERTFPTDLLQSIVCNGDGTIEPAETINDGGRHGKRIHGMGYQHQCRDTSFLFDMRNQTVELWDWQQGDTLSGVFGARR